MSKLIMDRESMGYACPKEYIHFGGNLYKLEEMTDSYAFYTIVDQTLRNPESDKLKEKLTFWKILKKIFIGDTE